MTNKNFVLGIVMGVLIPVGVLASNLTLPHTFTAGTPIRAAEVNANFAAVATAVNSKLDSSAAGTKSGSRLKVIGYRSADGLAMPSYDLFDSQLGVYCQPFVATDGLVRCLPIDSFYADVYSTPTCASASQLSIANQSASLPGYPPANTLYIRDTAAALDAGVTGFVVRALVPYSGPTYVWSGGSCVSFSPPWPVYASGATVPPSTFQELTVGPL